MKSLIVGIMVLMSPLTLLGASLVDMDFSSGAGYTSGALGGQKHWATPAGNSSATVVSAGAFPSSPVGSDQLVYLAGASSSGTIVRNEYVFTESPIATPFTLDIWMMRSVGNSKNASYVNIATEANQGYGIWVGFVDNKFLYQKVNNVNSLTEEIYMAETWYRFHLEIDPSISQYNLTVFDESGDVVISTLSELKFREGGSGPKEIGVLRLNQDGGSGPAGLYVGGIEVGVIPEPSSVAIGAIGAMIAAGSLIRQRRKG